eukprot:1630415-Heterocapsa_arctica.AAC.1
MIDEMVVLIGKEQQDGEDEKAYCEAELEKSEDKLKMLVVKLTEEIKARGGHHCARQSGRGGDRAAQERDLAHDERRDLRAVAQEVVDAVSKKRDAEESGKDPLQVKLNYC